VPFDDSLDQRQPQPAAGRAAAPSGRGTAPPDLPLFFFRHARPGVGDLDDHLGGVFERAHLDRVAGR